DLSVDALDLIFLGSETEILNAMMGQHENIAGLLQRGLEKLEIRDFEIDVGQPWVRNIVCASRGPKFYPHCVKRDIDGIVFSPEGPSFPGTPTAGAAGTHFLSSRFILGQ